VGTVSDYSRFVQYDVTRGVTTLLVFGEDPPIARLIRRAFEIRRLIFVSSALSKYVINAVPATGETRVSPASVFHARKIG